MEYTSTESNQPGKVDVNVDHSGCFTDVDGESWELDLVRAYMDECETPLALGQRQMERVFETQPEGRRAGAYVKSSTAEYEIGKYYALLQWSTRLRDRG